MVEVFRGLGLTAVPTEGVPFDPEVHDAIMREPSVDEPEGFVMQEFRRGFTYNGTLLRPAMVKVSTAPEAVTPKTDAPVDESNPSSAEEQEGEVVDVESSTVDEDVAAKDTEDAKA
mmetsp:Transcript_46541/g.88866  ORF Transcript_46541/g.88866 Transcript_46541/m.88866 type:complete len:116 (+) Transcript_46541:1442-1789(+)